MKLSASISAHIRLDKDESYDEAKERVVKELIKTIDDWLEGDVSPLVTYKYEHEEDNLKVNRKEIN
tara:strand:- start:530 stop:727 length:198 start_codon:yes stop_codon:yes gene_type:complete